MTTRCCNNCQPEFPDNITVNNNTFELDSEGFSFRRESLTFALVGSAYQATLDYYPASIASIKLFMNGVLQKIGTSFAVLGRNIVLTFTPIAGAVFEVYYLSTATITAPAGDWNVGDVISTMQSAAPDGWLLADGSAVSRTTYAALFAVIGTTYGVGDGSTTFNLPDGFQTLYNEGVFQQINAIIKY